MTYLDAISAISVIYAKKGYVTERDISFVMVKYNVPRSEIGIIYDILNNFSLDIREKDLEANEKTVSIAKEENHHSKCLNRIMQQNNSTVTSCYVPDLLFFNTSTCKATRRLLDNNQFVLYSGAVISDTVSNSSKSHNSISKNRTRYRGIIEKNMTIENIIFNSSSAAACFICGYSVNGKIAWKNESGVTLKQLLGEE